MDLAFDAYGVDFVAPLSFEVWAKDFFDAGGDGSSSGSPGSENPRDKHMRAKMNGKRVSGSKSVMMTSLCLCLNTDTFQLLQGSYIQNKP